MTTPRTIQIEERVPLLQSIPLSLQHLFAMFGATVLVPLLVGLHPSVTLFTSGVGTLLYILITKGKIPAYLGSSFAFIAAIASITHASFGVPGSDELIGTAMGGVIVVGLIYVVVALAIGQFGSGWINKLLPPVVIGPVVMVIGLGLAQVAVAMATTGSGVAANVFNPALFRGDYFAVAMAALVIAILAAQFLKGFLGVIPILIGVVGGYLVADAAGQVNFDAVLAAGAFAVPHFVLPRFDLGAIILLAPISLVVITEHIGHLIVTNNVVGRDLVKDPGLHRSLAGDGVATMFSGLLGGAAQHHLRREHRRHGGDPGLLGLGHRRRGGHGHRHVLPPQGGRAPRLHPGPRHGRHLHPALRDHRLGRRPHDGRGQDRLLAEAEPDHRLGHPGDRHRRRQAPPRRHRDRRDVAGHLRGRAAQPDPAQALGRRDGAGGDPG